MALSDGKIAVNEMYFLIAGKFWKKMFESIDSNEIDRVIFPDFSVSFFEKIMELISQGESKYSSNEVTYQFLCCNIHEKYYSSFEVIESNSCKFCLKIFKNKQTTELHEKTCKLIEKDWKCEDCSTNKEWSGITLLGQTSD